MVWPTRGFSTDANSPTELSLNREPPGGARDNEDSPAAYKTGRRPGFYLRCPLSVVVVAPLHLRHDPRMHDVYPPPGRNSQICKPAYTRQGQPTVMTVAHALRLAPPIPTHHHTSYGLLRLLLRKHSSIMGKQVLYYMSIVYIRIEHCSYSYIHLSIQCTNYSILKGVSSSTGKLHWATGMVWPITLGSPYMPASIRFIAMQRNRTRHCITVHIFNDFQSNHILYAYSSDSKQFLNTIEAFIIEQTKDWELRIYR